MDSTIKLRDKYTEADEISRQFESRKNFERGKLFGRLANEHEQRIKAHIKRIKAEERFMEARGIKPWMAGSAEKFDKLMLRRPAHKEASRNWTDEEH